MNLTNEQQQLDWVCKSLMKGENSRRLAVQCEKLHDNGPARRVGVRRGRTVWKAAYKTMLTHGAAPDTAYGETPDVWKGPSVIIVFHLNVALLVVGRSRTT